MFVFHRVLFILIITLFVSTSCQNCSDANCKTCNDDPAVCNVCKTNYILVNLTCLPCNSVINNCNVCNDTVLPLQCVSCNKGFYGSSDFSTCDTCSNLIENCARCQYQAPFQKVQCNQCIDDWKVSDDQSTCIQPTNMTIIIILVAVVVVVVGLVLGCFFLRRWLKKKKLESPLLQEDYQKAG